MTVGIVGLGLIGGSIAKAIKDNTDCKVLGRDISEQVMYKARLLGVIDGELEDELLSECDLVIVAIYPGDTVDYVISRAGFFKRGGIVLDCCGIKRKVCDALEQPAKENGFIFVGGHPMAGREFSGFEYSKKNLFEKASMILTPYKGQKLKSLQTQNLFSANRFLCGKNNRSGRTRPNDSLYLTACPRGIKRLCKKPVGAQSQGVFRRKLQGYDKSG